MRVHVLVGLAAAFLGWLLLASGLGVLLVYREPVGAFILTAPGLLFALLGLTHAQRAMRLAARSR